MGSISALEKPHAVCVPYPAQGHVTPMLNVAKLLHARGFHVTFVNSEYNHRRLQRSRGPAELAGLPDFRFATIPDGLPPTGDDDVTQDIPSLCESTMKTCLEPFRRLLEELNDPASGVPPVSCVVSDCVMSFTLDAAKELGVPDVLLWTASAISFMGYRHYRLLFKRGLAPLKDLDQFTNGYLDTAVDDVPGLKNMRIRDFPSFIRTTNRDDFMITFCLGETERAAEASAVILNSFDELEGDAVTAMAAILPRVYTLGPLPAMAAQAPPSPASSMALNLWKEEPECLQWLEGKKPGSVVYVNFGSITVMTNHQLIEFAWGLANSGHEFLWIIRPDLIKGDDAVLPPEFAEETANRGLLASWCPQQEVLRHPAVGVFLTHSGWNSTLESLCGGVPVLSWPFFADQQTNCRYACTEWGVGMEIDSNVKRGVVEGMIREMMGGEKGMEMKRKAMEWKQSATKATMPGGPSFANFDKLVREVLLPSSKF